jgi:hypothetical protein
MVLQVWLIWVLLSPIMVMKLQAIYRVKISKNRLRFDSCLNGQACINSDCDLPFNSLRESEKTNYGVHCDVDTNRDGKLDTSDIKSLYLSDISGKKFH